MIYVTESERPTNFFKKRISEITRELNRDSDEQVPNPYLEARPFINEIIKQNRRISLKTGELNIPDFDEPEESDPLGEPITNTQTGAIPTPSPVVPNLTEPQQNQSTIPNNFGSLPTVEKLKILRELGLNIQ